MSDVRKGVSAVGGWKIAGLCDFKIGCGSCQSDG